MLVVFFYRFYGLNFWQKGFSRFPGTNEQCSFRDCRLPEAGNSRGMRPPRGAAVNDTIWGLWVLACFPSNPVWAWDHSQCLRDIYANKVCASCSSRSNSRQGEQSSLLALLVSCSHDSDTVLRCAILQELYRCAAGG